MQDIESIITAKFQRACSVERLAELAKILDPIKSMIAAIRVDCKEGTIVEMVIPKGERPKFEAVIAELGEFLSHR